MERLKRVIKAIIELDPIVEAVSNSKLSNWLHIFAGFMIAHIDFTHAVLLVAMYFTYQIIEYVKRRDSIVNDLREFLAGYVIGLISVYFGVDVPTR